MWDIYTNPEGMELLKSKEQILADGRALSTEEQRAAAEKQRKLKLLRRLLRCLAPLHQYAVFAASRSSPLALTSPYEVVCSHSYCATLGPA